MIRTGLAAIVMAASTVVAGQAAAGGPPARGDDPVAAKQAQGMSAYYVGEVLRVHGGDSADCRKT
jgi:hypothetical protein